MPTTQKPKQIRHDSGSSDKNSEPISTRVNQDVNTVLSALSLILKKPVATIVREGLEHYLATVWPGDRVADELDAYYERERHEEACFKQTSVQAAQNLRASRDATNSSAV